MNTSRLKPVAGLFVTIVLFASAAWGKDAANSTKALGRGSAPPNSRFALLVGIEQYEGIPSLPGPNKDVCVLREVLVSAAGFRPENVTVLAHRKSCPKVSTLAPTSSIFLRSLRGLISKMPPRSSLLIAFSGHGFSKDGESFLLMQDSVQLKGAFTKTVKVSDLVKTILDNSRSLDNLLLLIDACRDSTGVSNGMSRGPESEQAFKQISTYRNLRSASIIFSADLGEQSYVRSTGPVSFFTWAIIRGLIGEAADANGVITVGSLAQYVEKEVPELLRFDFLSDKKGHQQHPKSLSYGEKPLEFVIATVPLPKTRFFYSVEAFIVPQSAEGKIVLTPQHEDLVSPRPLGSLDETLPLDVIEVKPLTLITLPYRKKIDRSVDNWEYLVRMTFHYGRWHRSFILCRSSPQIPVQPNAPDIKTYFENGTLVIDALKSFAQWGNCLRDPEACFREGEEDSVPKIEYKRITGCFSLDEKPPK
jgi:hypothetical protein